MANQIILTDQGCLKLQISATYTPPDILGEKMRYLDIQMQQLMGRNDIALGDTVRLYHQIYKIIFSYPVGA